MRVTILGSGASTGVPAIGCSCQVCTSTNPLNQRTRASIYIEYKNTALMVDTSPDLYQQAIKNNITKISAVLYSHAHADHIMGIDDLRSFNYLMDKVIPAYGLKETMEELKNRFPYVFKPLAKAGIWYKPCVQENIIKSNSSLKIGDIEFNAFPQWHGKMCTLGFRFGNIAYSTDTNQIDKDVLKSLYGIKVWIVDCAAYKASPTHAHLDLALEWIDIVKPELAILTHLGHTIDYDELKTQIPSNVIPAHDGLSLEV